MSTTLIISDTHLGRGSAGAGSAEALAPLLNVADELIVNGDAADVHDPEFGDIARRELEGLLGCAERAGTALTFVTGNHDPFASDAHALHRAGGSVFLTHGDAVSPFPSPWSAWADTLRAEFEASIAARPAEQRGELDALLAASREAAWAVLKTLDKRTKRSSLRHVMRHPGAAIRVLNAWLRFPNMTSSFAARHAPGAAAIVVGHTHRPFLGIIDGRLVVNTGCFAFPGHPLGVLLRGDELSVHRVVRRDARWHLHERSLLRHAIDGPNETAVVEASGQRAARDAAVPAT